ncbi:MAG: shikimate kinase [Anaerovoracaceae bacterium]|jgi:shikimate kinase
MIIYVTGPLGSRRKETAQKLAARNNMDYLDFDEEIKQRDGRSISRIVMTMGEHEYRNKEYELLEEFTAKMEDGVPLNLVCACSDGILLDPMCADLARKGNIVIADADLTAEELWDQAKDDASIPYAFMMDADEERKKEKFLRMYELRKQVYEEFI